jgi:archaellum component FlaC
MKKQIEELNEKLGKNENDISNVSATKGNLETKLKNLKKELDKMSKENEALRNDLEKVLCDFNFSTFFRKEVII